MDESVDERTLRFMENGSPFRLLSSLRVELDSGEAWDFRHYQNDAVFGLRLESAGDEPQQRTEWNRLADLSCLPTGRIDSVDLHLDNRSRSWRDVIEVRFTVGGRQLLVVAAEVEPGPAGDRYVWGDEEFFVFTDERQADRIEWSGSREFFVAPVNRVRRDAS